MKLKTYAKYIAGLAEKHPNADVIFSIDEEGNGYKKVQFKPSEGDFDGDYYNPHDYLKVNAVCVN